jgi:hypothetical protein
VIVAQWTLSYAPSKPKLPRQWFRVYVHDSAETLRKAAVQYDTTGTAAEFRDALGICQEAIVLYQDDDADFSGPVHYSRGGFAGVIRLAQDHLVLEIVLHEVVHADCIAFRRLYARDLDLGDGFESIENEERFAYIYGHLAAHMVLALDELSVRV